MPETILLANFYGSYLDCDKFRASVIINNAGIDQLATEGVEKVNQLKSLGAHDDEIYALMVAGLTDVLTKSMNNGKHVLNIADNGAQLIARKMKSAQERLNGAGAKVVWVVMPAISLRMYHIEQGWDVSRIPGMTSGLDEEQRRLINLMLEYRDLCITLNSAVVVPTPHFTDLVSELSDDGTSMHLNTGFFESDGISPTQPLVSSWRRQVDRIFSSINEARVTAHGIVTQACLSGAGALPVTTRQIISKIEREFVNRRVDIGSKESERIERRGYEWRAYDLERIASDEMRRDGWTSHDPGYEGGRCSYDRDYFDRGRRGYDGLDYGRSAAVDDYNTQGRYDGFNSTWSRNEKYSRAYSPTLPSPRIHADHQPGKEPPVLMDSNAAQLLAESLRLAGGIPTNAWGIPEADRDQHTADNTHASWHGEKHAGAAKGEIDNLTKLEKKIQAIKRQKAQNVKKESQLVTALAIQQVKARLAEHKEALSPSELHIDNDNSVVLFSFKNHDDESTPLRGVAGPLVAKGDRKSLSDYRSRGLFVYKQPEAVVPPSVGFLKVEVKQPGRLSSYEEKLADFNNRLNDMISESESLLTEGRSESYVVSREIDELKACSAKTYIDETGETNHVKVDRNSGPWDKAEKSNGENASEDFEAIEASPIGSPSELRPEGDKSDNSASDTVLIGEGDNQEVEALSDTAPRGDERDKPDEPFNNARWSKRKRRRQTLRQRKNEKANKTRLC